MLDSRFSPQVTQNEDNGRAIGFCWKKIKLTTDLVFVLQQLGNGLGEDLVKVRVKAIQCTVDTDCHARFIDTTNQRRNNCNLNKIQIILTITKP